MAEKPWPRCGITTKHGVPCKASGQGIGGRCRYHGGCTTSPKWKDRRYVLVDPGPYPERKRWELGAIPVDHYVSGKRSAAWPKAIGFRIVLRLLELGRVAFADLHTTHALMRALHRPVSKRFVAREVGETGQAVRVDPDEMLAAMRQAGKPLKRPSPNPPGVSRSGTLTESETPVTRLCSLEEESTGSEGA